MSAEAVIVAWIVLGLISSLAARPLIQRIDRAYQELGDPNVESLPGCWMGAVPIMAAVLGPVGLVLVGALAVHLSMVRGHDE